MKRGHKMHPSASRHQFKRSASHIHKKNLHSGSVISQRGGIRL